MRWLQRIPLPAWIGAEWTDLKAFQSAIPCRECMDLLLELDRPVRYIFLTTHAYEHKVFVPSFQRRFPLAQVYYSPKCALSKIPLPPPATFQCPVGVANDACRQQ